ncbi:MAG: HD domain-containing protein [Armatimonadia bacterium]
MNPELVREAWQQSPARVAIEQAAASLGVPLYVVGGAVRDALLSRRVDDWDLATPAAGPLAQAIAAATGAHLVVLHEDTQTCRLVLHEGEPLHYDLVSFRAPDLAADLRARDFSFNALAWDIARNTLIDPASGLSDLQSGTIRALGLANLHGDPLRCLRAYRFYSQFGFEIESQTRDWLGQVSPEFPRVAGERLGQEFLKTLQPGRAAAALRLMDADGVLGQLLPEIEPMRGVEQGGFHHLDVWGHTLEVVASLEDILLAPQDFLPNNTEALAAYLSRRDLPATLLFTALLHDFAKPECRCQDERGWWRFFDHDRVGAHVAHRIARRLRLRREVTETTTRLIRNHLRPLQLANLRLPQPGHEPQEITMSALRRLFRETHPDGIGLLLLALADASGCRGPATAGDYHAKLAPVLDEMLTRYLHWRNTQPLRPLLSGQDLIEAGYQPAPWFGQVLAAVEDAHADELVHTKAEALKFAATEIARLQEPDAPETK